MTLPPLIRSGVVLAFHSVTTTELPSLSNTHVTLRELGDIVRGIRMMGRIVPLSELVARHREGRSTAGLVAITFDDAYRALLDYAELLFVRAAIPATVFVATAATRSKGRFWWDRLEEALALASPERWHRFERDCGMPEAFASGQPAEEGLIRPIRQWLLAEHRGHWPAHFEPLLIELEQNVGAASVHRPMSFEELDQFAAIPGIDIGVHSESHAVLPFLSPSEWTREVRGCHAELRQRYPNTRPFLAIPFGLFDANTARQARDSGMDAAFTLREHTFRSVPRDSVLLPRICVMHGVPHWKLFARALGVWQVLRPQRSTYPALPSPTT